MQPSSQKVIPVQIDGASAPPAPQAEPDQQGMLNEWWNWITLHKHAPGTYSGGRRIYPQQNVQPMYDQSQYPQQYPQYGQQNLYQPNPYGY